MIIGPDFVWLHFPKCAGTTLDLALRDLLAGRPGITFDEVDHQSGYWHHTIAERKRADQSFDPSGKRIISCIRRLPSWLMSLVLFEAERNPRHIPTREMIVRGQCYNGSEVNQADFFMDLFSGDVNQWIRIEHLALDVATAFNLDLIDVSEALERHRTNVATTHIRDIAFWFTDHDLATLYDNNPAWASVETRVYGSVGMPLAKLKGETFGNDRDVCRGALIPAPPTRPDTRRPRRWFEPRWYLGRYTR